MRILAIAFNLCLDIEPACDPQYVYVAHFATERECRDHIVPGAEALHCLKYN